MTSVREDDVLHEIFYLRVSSRRRPGRSGYVKTDTRSLYEVYPMTRWVSRVRTTPLSAHISTYPIPRLLQTQTVSSPVPVFQGPFPVCPTLVPHLLGRTLVHVSSQIYPKTLTREILGEKILPQIPSTSSLTSSGGVKSCPFCSYPFEDCDLCYGPTSSLTLDP